MSACIPVVVDCLNPAHSLENKEPREESKLSLGSPHLRAHLLILRIMTVHWVFHAFCTLPVSTGLQAQTTLTNARVNEGSPCVSSLIHSPMDPSKSLKSQAVDEDDVNNGYDNVVFFNSDYHTKAPQTWVTSHQMIHLPLSQPCWEFSDTEEGPFPGCWTLLLVLSRQRTSETAPQAKAPEAKPTWIQILSVQVPRIRIMGQENWVLKVLWQSPPK